MKMKKIATKFSAIALMALALTSCNKKTNTAPEPDMEFQSSLDASAATMIAADIDMMVAQSSEYSYMQFYSHGPNAGPNVVVVNRNDTLNKLITLEFYNAKGYDGKVRNGKMVINFGTCATGTATSAGQVYARNPNHMSAITFINYSVNKYKLDNASTFSVINTTPAGYTRSVTPLTWKLVGNLLIKDTTKSLTDNDIQWNGNLAKTLVNSTSNTIHPSPLLPIVWTTTNTAIKSTALNAIVRYTGTATGFTNKNVNYTYTIDAENPLERNFGCSPDYWINKEHHPFITGKVTFKTGDKSQRWIYYSDKDGNKTCDNSGILYIEGNSYSVDFLQ